MMAPKTPDSVATPPGPDRPLTVRRFAYASEALAGEVPRRTFDLPRRALAVEIAHDSPAPAESLEIAIVAPDLGDSRRAAAWLLEAGESLPASPLSVELEGGALVEWRPGRATLRAPLERVDEITDGLLDFAFFEGELRSLEALVESREDRARQDVVLAHRISRRDRGQWGRIGETIERLTLARLDFARLEAMFARIAVGSSADRRRLVKRLSNRSDASGRLETLSDRLEVLEDLYEGANDRIADFRGWHNGHVLEVAIVILLLLEVALVSVDMVVHAIEYRQDHAAAEAEADDVKGIR